MEWKVPAASEVINTTSAVIENWHRGEGDISSIEDAFEKLETGSADSVARLIERLSIINTALWHEEDKARDRDASDTAIADTKRLIDRLNAMRAETVEIIDSELVAAVELNESAPLNTETPGSVIDRLTILCLKRYHMSREAEREDSTEDHRSRCRDRLLQIEDQMGDLMHGYDFFIQEMQLGRRRFKLYRQFKMYNDPELNPYLYRKRDKH